MYELGVGVAVFITAMNLFFSFIKLHSPETSNYKRIGKKYKFLSGEFENIDPNASWLWGAIKVVFWIAFQCFLFSLSWLTVGVSIFWWGYLVFIRLLMPDEMKKSLWKMKYTNLSKEEMAKECLIFAGNFSEANLRLYLNALNERLGESSNEQQAS